MMKEDAKYEMLIKQQKNTEIWSQRLFNSCLKKVKSELSEEYKRQMNSLQ